MMLVALRWALPFSVVQPWIICSRICGAAVLPWHRCDDGHEAADTASMLDWAARPAQREMQRHGVERLVEKDIYHRTHNHDGMDCIQGRHASALSRQSVGAKTRCQLIDEK